MTVDTRPAKTPGSPVPQEGKCGAKLGNGRFCIRPPIAGAKRCRLHGSGTPEARRAAAAKVLQAKLNRELEVRGWAPVTNPAAELADIAGETLAFKDMARERINELSSWEHEGAFDAQDVHAAVKVYQWALEQCEKILSRMASLGLTAELLHESLALEAERPTREQVEKLTAVLNRILSDSRVSVSGDARSVVVDAMTAEGLG